MSVKIWKIYEIQVLFFSFCIKMDPLDRGGSLCGYFWFNPKLFFIYINSFVLKKEKHEFQQLIICSFFFGGGMSRSRYT